MKPTAKSLFVKRAGVVTLALLPLLGLGVAHAQPNVNNAPKAQNPTNRPARPPRMDRAALQAMTPEQRLKEMMRLQFQRVGVTDDAIQATLLTYIEGEVKARMALMEQSRQLQTGMRGDALSDTQVTSLLNNYQAAVEEDKARRQKAEADLKKVLDLSKMPKVEATLTLMGFYGDAPSMMMGMMMGGERRGGRDEAAGRGETRRNRAGGAPAANGAAPATAPTQPVRPRRNRQPAAPATAAVQG